MKDKNFYMEEALKEAMLCFETEDVPVGAVIVKDGEIIARGRNIREKEKQAVSHAETEAISKACEKLGTPFLDGCDIYVTLEPCPMCAGAILQARLRKVTFGAYEDKSGAVGSVFNLFYDYKFPHKVLFEGGVMEEKCKKLLTVFFKEKR